MLTKGPTPTPKPPSRPVTTRGAHPDKKLAQASVSNRTFAIVAIGASAGGLDAFTRLFQHLPPDTGMAFVIIQHLAPHHASMLATLLARTTQMPVSEVHPGTLAQPNHIHVIPPNKQMSISGGLFVLEPRLAGRPGLKPIDYFFQSLAADQQGRAIGVVLSGTDSDGTLGLKSIKAQGGIAIAQDEGSAKFEDMPRNAAASGVVDLVLPPEGIAAELARIAQNGRPPDGPRAAPGVEREKPGAQHLGDIFGLLRTATGVDFRHYKLNTVNRRIRRRMILHHCRDLGGYVQVLQSQPAEVQALYQDLLIKVTHFFRDPATFEALKCDLLKRLLKGRKADLPLRVWVPGCSTGEEVYSLAMCIFEGVGETPLESAVQIFGTDIDEAAIERARSGIYPDDAVAKISPERVRRFFMKLETGHYQIVKDLRAACVFAHHNLAADFPFSRLDIVSCRNVLIYFQPSLQRRIIPAFHYALKPGGYLILGSSEAIPTFGESFTLLDKQHKFYVKNSVATPPVIDLPEGGSRPPSIPGLAAKTAKQDWTELTLQHAVDRVIVTKHGPPGVVVNARMEVVLSHGDVSPFLHLTPGAPSFSILKMAAEGLRAGLRTMLARSIAENTPTEASAGNFMFRDKIRNVKLTAHPLSQAHGQDRRFLVLFNLEPPAEGAAEPSGSADRVPPRILDAPPDLAITREYMESLLRERDAGLQDLTVAHEEVQSGNEELQSSNEELQSTNEELQTAKEELQATNDELNTLNDELQSRNQELNRLNDDLRNLLSSTTMPIVMLDNDLKIRRITPASERMMNLRPSDLGRPLTDIRMKLSVDDLEPLLREVLRTLGTKEVELQDGGGHWHVLRVRPYRTADHRIEGVVLVLVDIDELRRERQQAQAARDFARTVVDCVQTPLVVLQKDFRIRSANQAFCSKFGIKNNAEGKPFFDFQRKQWDAGKLKQSLKKLAYSTSKTATATLELNRRFTGLGMRNILIHARPIKSNDEKMILLAADDITDRKRAELVLSMERTQLEKAVLNEALQLARAGKSLKAEKFGRRKVEGALHETEEALLRSRKQLRALTGKLFSAQDDERRRISRELHDDLSQKVALIEFNVQRLEQQLPSHQKPIKQRLDGVRGQVGAFAKDLRRIAHQLHPSTLEHLGLGVALRTLAEEFSMRTGIPVKARCPNVPMGLAPPAASSLYRIAQEALQNVAKHGGPGAAATISLTRTGNDVRLLIQDTGRGFDTKALGKSRGLGLISMQERIRLLRGSFALSSRPGHGVRINLRAPLPEKQA